MFGIGSKFLKYFALMKENLQEEIGEKMYDISSSYDILNVISNKMIFGFSKKIRSKRKIIRRIVLP